MPGLIQAVNDLLKANLQLAKAIRLAIFLPGLFHWHEAEGESLNQLLQSFNFLSQRQESTQPLPI